MSVRRTIAVITALLGLILVTAGPASAATGSWQAYGNTNPITSSPHKWVCASSKAIATDVLARVCVIRTASGGSAQGAVIVRNNRSSAFSTTARVDLWTAEHGQFDWWYCTSSGVGANSWSVCFGRSQAVPSSNLANSTGYARELPLGFTGLV
ncbi:hypothetical protein OG205_37055 [Lentzea sp. NBC_00516]|uniref:hypothetical protein n=1 Tax=Lentzea sp. NBC_00516 TaxID=2903582 RepID=UPI002E7FB5D3|nr:hypothetical protein [Lentzea sp. NBC_00516]WUD23612.1 hypothetical protein OG205_37055 [Lentzea sp. NBC_00516]